LAAAAAASHAIPAMREEAAALIAVLVFAGEWAPGEGAGQVLSPPRRSVGSKE